MRKFAKIALAVCGALVATATPASAAVLFATAANDPQIPPNPVEKILAPVDQGPLALVTGVTNAVVPQTYTFASTSHLLSITGAAGATVSGSGPEWHTLTFAAQNPLVSFSAIEFKFHASTSGGAANAVLVDIVANHYDGGSTLFSDKVLGNGNSNQFYIWGTGGTSIKSLTFTAWREAGNVNPRTILSMNSIEVDSILNAPVVNGVPEPATWAMMLLGFGLIGGAMRSRRQTATRAHFAI